ncbi:hypothetical protein AB0B66_33965 [Catellatospora sp. NPDC049111]|uniref:hypothetical protein n=1 Tax=Catellatospora sp. NPDC049111 TaxID=3155271 RepID=UPI0033DABE0E
MSTRHALCVGVPLFGPRSRPGEESLPGAWPAMPFAPQRTQALAEVLTRLGYTCRVVTEGMAAADLGGIVAKAIDDAGPDDVLIVHVLSHGHVTESGALYVVGGDGEHHLLTDVDRWLHDVTDFSDRNPMTLFLLDICHAGTAARQHWQPVFAGGGNRAWVIAACGPWQSAFNGRFTEAITQTLQRLADGDLDIDRSYRNVPIGTVARAVRRAVNALAADAKAMAQQVTATLVDISSEPPELAFFPNLAHTPRLARPAVDAAVMPFLDELDEALDARHFVGRASGSPTAGDGQHAGYFSGRSREMKILSRWVDGRDDAGLRVLTGSPGVGKSAILGILVCAAHPDLSDHTRAVWEHVDKVPYVNRHLAAVHARQRNVDHIARSICRQLAPTHEIVGDATRAALHAAAATTNAPVIILDALDEALDGVEIMTRLLLPLSRLKRADQAPVRLLVGMRPLPEFTPLRAAAADGVLNLDDVDSKQLGRDISNYVTALLLTDRRWDHVEYAGVAHGLARAVAEALAKDARHREWGAFLVAGLFAHHVLTAYAEPLHDMNAALKLGATVPRTLPDLLALDLGTRAANPWLKPILQALAHACGDGMPVELVRRTAAVFSEDGQEPDLSAARAALAEVAFYLRHSADVDGTTRYRLFHQGLTDHLYRAADAAAVFNALLASLEAPDGARQWQIAEPYLQRHATDHARAAGSFEDLLSDIGFVLSADRAALATDMAQTTNPRVRQLTALLSLAEHDPRFDDPAQRAEVLVAAALVLGAGDLLHDLVRAGGRHPRWTPLWSGGVQNRPPARAALGTLGSRPVVACPDQRSVAVYGLDGQDPARLSVSLDLDRIRALAIGSPGGLDLLLVADDHSRLHVFSMPDGTRFAAPIYVLGNVDELRLETLFGQPYALVGQQHVPAALWDLRSGKRLAILPGFDMPPPAVLVDGAVVTAAADMASLAEITVSGLGRTPARLTSGAGPIVATTVGVTGNLPYVACGDSQGTVTVIDFSNVVRVTVPMIGAVRELTADDAGTLLIRTDRSVAAIRVEPWSPASGRARAGLLDPFILTAAATDTQMTATPLDESDTAEIPAVGEEEAVAQARPRQNRRWFDLLDIDAEVPQPGVTAAWESKSDQSREWNWPPNHNVRFDRLDSVTDGQATRKSTVSATQHPSAQDEDDEEPADEPAAQQVSAEVAAQIARMSLDVMVIDGRPRFHMPVCVHLLGRPYEPLPVSEAVELGFSSCVLCEPATALTAPNRRI